MDLDGLASIHSKKIGLKIETCPTLVSFVVILYHFDNNDNFTYPLYGCNTKTAAV